MAAGAQAARRGAIAGTPFLRSPGLVLTLPILLPPAYLIWLAMQVEVGSLLMLLAQLDMPGLLLNTLLLSVGSTALALALGVPWAWLVVRTDLPARRLFELLGPLPLAIPPYVGALAYAALLAPGGLLHSALAAAAQQPLSLLPYQSAIYSTAGGILVLGCFSAPYVFLTVRSGLEQRNPALEEAARGLGLSSGEILRQVTLPLLRPALLAAGFVVFLYSWVDFAVVSLLRVRTFTTVIYTQLLAGLNLSEAAATSLLLLALVGVLLTIQRRLMGDARYAQVGERAGRASPERQQLGRAGPLWLAYLSLCVALTLVVPLGVLVLQALRMEPAALSRFLGQQWTYLGNTLVVATAGATAAATLGLLVAWVDWRLNDDWPARLVQLGFAIPGTVLGLSLVAMSLALFPPIYGTPLLLAHAYVALFCGPAEQAVRAALGQVAPSMEEAARALGRSAVGAAREVVVPLAWPGILSGWLLAFILCTRELAATLVLRPPGFDTLPVRIWVHTMDVGIDPRASVDALLLVALVAISWGLLLRLPGRAMPVSV